VITPQGSGSFRRGESDRASHPSQEDRASDELSTPDKSTPSGHPTGEEAGLLKKVDELQARLNSIEHRGKKHVEMLEGGSLGEKMEILDGGRLGSVSLEVGVEELKF
jgi:hypothetical protein